MTWVAWCYRERAKAPRMVFYYEYLGPTAATPSIAVRHYRAVPGSMAIRLLLLPCWVDAWSVRIQVSLGSYRASQIQVRSFKTGMTDVDAGYINCLLCTFKQTAGSDDDPWKAGEMRPLTRCCTSHRVNTPKHHIKCDFSEHHISTRTLKVLIPYWFPNIPY